MYNNLKMKKSSTIKLLEDYGDNRQQLYQNERYCMWSVLIFVILIALGLGIGLGVGLREGPAAPTTPIPTCFGNQLQNPSFETGNLDYWVIPPQTTPFASYNNSLKVVSGVCDDGTYCLQAGIANTSCTKPSDPDDLVGSSVYQSFLFSDCSINISFSYSVIAENDEDNIQIYVGDAPTSGFPILSFTTTLVPIPFTTYNCNVCDGSCGGYDISSAYSFGQTLIIQLLYISYSPLCGGILWDNVCIK
jgi:hypothetical protein